VSRRPEENKDHTFLVLCSPGLSVNAVPRHCNRLCLQSQCLLPQRFKQDARQVPLTEVRQHHHDQLPCILLPRRHLQGRSYSRSRTDADEEPFFMPEPARHLNRFVVRHLNHFVDLFGVEHTRYKPGTQSLDFVWTWLAT